MQNYRRLTWWHTDVAQQQSIEQDERTVSLDQMCREVLNRIQSVSLDRVEPRNWTGYRAKSAQRDQSANRGTAPVKYKYKCKYKYRYKAQ